MNDLNERIVRAKSDGGELDSLLRDYLPFVQGVIAKQGYANVEYDEQLSVAMLVFVNCISQFDAEKGNFLTYLGVAIANRLKDEGKKQARATRQTISLDDTAADTAIQLASREAALQDYSVQEERQQIAEEIDMLSAALADYGIAFFDLEKVAPRQKRSRQLCAQLAHTILGDADMLDSLRRTKRLPARQLADKSGQSLKTLDKHRRYIMALVVILSGDYPSIQTFIPREEVSR
ncbi:MAG: hypothetical protein GXY32_07355 [Ruminococcaceae bacterium]|nr:hypothetical protein [Oscillospiraceae bacterium]